MNVNTKAILFSTSVIIPIMLKQARGGSFIQIASTAAKRPRPGLTWYNASKAATKVATKSMAVEFAPEGIRFNSVSPVVGGTGM
jgi:NAD(P)-dependent dehydrogenase (short-subunit alcohol dehydrogenase family)